MPDPYLDPDLDLKLMNKPDPYPKKKTMDIPRLS
jgi:hypothetical protein